MAKYSKKVQDKIEDNLHEMKKGTLKSVSGKKVTDPQQAIAIWLSQACKAGAMVPKKAGAKKGTSKKTATKKAAAKKKP